MSTTSKKFTKYPTNADKYFQTHVVRISALPSSVAKDVEIKEIQFKSAKQYVQYIEREIAFWKENDPGNILESQTKTNVLERARHEFLQAIDYYTDNTSSSNGDYGMTQSLNLLASGHLCSKTKLAGFLLKHKDKGQRFINGIMTGLGTDRSQNIPSNIDSFEGFITALEYKKVTKGLTLAATDEINSFKASLQEAKENFSKLDSEYTMSFHDQEARLESFSQQAETQIRNLKTESEQYFAEREKRCLDLETLYEEKLKLQAPAEYWEEMSKEYTTKGRLWLGISIAFTAVIVGILIATLALLPNLFSEESHWFDVFKNSAIITVITSIAVYMLRLFVKLSTSSLHLARDAKERNKLTYFYLALIEKKAVTEKERAIVLNALFSRADTGLLKGDSAPTMSGNVVELVQGLSK